MKKFVAHKNSWWIFIKLVEVIVSFRMAQWPNGPISWDKSSWIVYIGKFYFLRKWLVLHSQKLINITYQKINCVIILWANWQFWRPTFFIGEIFFLHKNEFWTNIFDLPGLRYIFTREPWLRAGLTIWFLLLQKTHLTICTQNVPKQKFSLEIVPKYKFTHIKNVN